MFTNRYECECCKRKEIEVNNTKTSKYSMCPCGGLLKHSAKEIILVGNSDETLPF